MAKGMGARIVKGLAIGIGAAMEGYGKGSLDVAMRARDEYMQAQRDARTAAMAQEAAEQQRTWTEAQAEKEREHDFAKMEKAQEFNLSAQERTLQNQLTLEKMKQAGKGSGKGGGAPGITRTITDAEGNVWGITKTGEKVDLGIKGKVTGGRSGSGDAITKTITDADGNVWGITKTGEKVDLGIKGNVPRTANDPYEATPNDLAAELKSVREMMADPMNPNRRALMKMAPEERKQFELGMAIENLETSGKSVPDRLKAGLQKSVTEVPQPGVQEAPPTSTAGDKPTDATPSGQGSESSPFMALTPEQQEWVIKNAPSGSYVSDGKKVFRKP